MLQVRDLAVARGGRRILTDVSFQVAPGQALILRGPNGIGKTSLLRVLAGVQPAPGGQVIAPDDSCAYASHKDGVKSQLSVTENLRFWARVYGRDLPDHVFDDFDLRDLRDRPAASLSAGQSRRLGLARLGVIGRQILLLDEPTVSLDTASVALFARFLRDQHLAQGGIAVIATHIDLGLDAPSLDLTPYQASPDQISDEAFL